MICALVGLRLQLAVAHELGEQLRVVQHLVAAAEVGVLVPERVEAVRAGRDDLRHPGLVQRLDVLLGVRLERVLVAHPARRIAGAALARPEDREVDPGCLQQLRGRARALARTLVVRRGAADPEQHLGRRVAGLQHPHVEAVRPGRALGLRLAPRVGAALDVAQHRRGLLGERDSTITRWRRRSTMWSMCSIETGHSRTQAPHVTQSHTTSSETAFGTRGVGVKPSPPSVAASRSGPSWKTWSRMPMIRSFGESSLPVA